MAHSQVPLKLRKQMLLMRAAVERVELAQHVLDVRQAATISAIVHNAMPGGRSRSLASRAIGLVTRFPFAASAVSLIASRFKLPLLKVATKWGGAATVGYKLWDAWRKTHPESLAPRRPARLLNDRSSN